MTTENNEKKTRKQLPPAKRYAARVARAIDSTNFIVKQLEHFPNDADAKATVEIVAKATGLLRDAHNALLGASDETLGGKVRKAVSLDEGATVCIREDKRANYEDVLEEDDMVNLTVKSVGQKKVKCLTSTGETIFAPRGDLIVQVAA